MPSRLDPPEDEPVGPDVHPPEPLGRQFPLRMVVTTDRVIAPLVGGGDVGAEVGPVLGDPTGSWWTTEVLGLVVGLAVLGLAGATALALLGGPVLSWRRVGALWPVGALAVVAVTVEFPALFVVRGVAPINAGEIGATALVAVVPSWISLGRAITELARVVP